MIFLMVEIVPRIRDVFAVTKANFPLHGRTAALHVSPPNAVSFNPKIKN